MSEKFEITDLVGLKEPVIKLIDVVSKGIGVVYEPRRVKKMADAKAYEIKSIKDAIGDCDLTNKSSYEDGKVFLSMTRDDDELLARMRYKEEKKADNIDKIVGNAYGELKDLEEISKDELDDDWITRFFRIAEDVTNEEMQSLWGKILAGEVKRPNTYTLRTLEFLKNLSQEEARKFSDVARFGIKSNVGYMMLSDEEFYKSNYNIPFSDFLFLDELNLVAYKDLMYTFAEVKNEKTSSLIYSDKVFIINRKVSPAKNINVLKFTKLGEQLMELIEVDFDPIYAKKIIDIISDSNNKVSCHQIIDEVGEKVRFSEQSIVL